MEALQSRVAVLGRGLALLAAYAVVASAISIVMYLGDAIDGQVPAVCRVIIAIWGLGAGILLWTGRRVGISGWQAVMAWAVIQIPYIAWNTEGSATTQLFDVPLTFTNSTTVNGEVTSFSEYGINLVGVALAIWASRVRTRRERQVEPAAHPEAAVRLYEIEHRAVDGTIHRLGGAHDLASAQRAAVSQAARLRSGGEQGEVVVIEQPGGAVASRESLA
jgi:hypothetical protein